LPISTPSGRDACRTVGWEAARIARTAFVASGAEGVYVVLRAPNDYARACFKEYGLKTDPSDWYAAMYKPYHLIGLELGISVLSAALRDEPTGQPCGFCGDVVTVAKRALRAGETLDGEGGYTVWGKLVPAERSLAEGALPIGPAHKVALLRDIAVGEIVRWVDVTVADSEAVRVRRDMEQRFASPPAAIAVQYRSLMTSRAAASGGKTSEAPFLYHHRRAARRSRLPSWCERAM
jgi:predicted homoserine dehydrogenase-like protein